MSKSAVITNSGNLLSAEAGEIIEYQVVIDNPYDVALAQWGVDTNDDGADDINHDLRVTLTDSIDSNLLPTTDGTGFTLTSVNVCDAALGTGTCTDVTANVAARNLCSQRQQHRYYLFWFGVGY